MIESLLLTTTLVRTFDGQRPLTAASGFRFARGESIFLVTSRHVLADAASGHAPNRIEIALHDELSDLTRIRVVSVWLFQAGRSIWRQGSDSGGDIDVAVNELDAQQLPQAAAGRRFTPAHLQATLEDVEVGRPVLIVGFPLGFHDAVHHLPVVRHVVIASAFGVRFQAPFTYTYAMAKSVQALLEDIRLVGEDQFHLVEAVRALVKKTIKPLSEEVKYGGILFGSGVQFGGVFAYKEHVSVEFSHGARITDQEGFLEGGGKGRRHVKLRTVTDIRSKKLASYLLLALAAARSNA